MADPQDRAEALDSDKLPGDHDDVESEPEYPLDELIGADEYGITAAEERVDEPIEERDDREQPDPLASELDRQVEREDRIADARSVEHGLAEVDSYVSAVDRDLGMGDPAELGFAADPEDEPIGRLAEPGTDEDVTDFIDAEAESVAEAFPSDDLSAEEAAMHRTADPPMGRPGGGYVQ